MSYINFYFRWNMVLIQRKSKAWSLLMLVELRVLTFRIFVGINCLVVITQSLIDYCLWLLINLYLHLKPLGITFTMFCNPSQKSSFFPYFLVVRAVNTNQVYLFIIYFGRISKYVLIFVVYIVDIWYELQYYDSPQTKFCSLVFVLATVCQCGILIDVLTFFSFVLTSEMLPIFIFLSLSSCIIFYALKF